VWKIPGWMYAAGSGAELFTGRSEEDRNVCDQSLRGNGFEIASSSVARLRSA